MERSKRRSRPALEGLEGRTLLNGSKGHSPHAEATRPPASGNTTLIAYATPQGAKVRVQLVGPGSLASSTVGGDGSLNLVFSGTSVFSAIKGTVGGGPGVAPLASIRDAGVPLASTTGIGGELIGLVSLPGFDLVRGGNINLLGGVNVLTLDSVAANSQVHLRDAPLNTTLGISSSATANTGYVTGNLGTSLTTTVTTALGSTTGTASTVAAGNVSGAGTLDPQISGFGGPLVGAVSGKIAIIPTVGNGQNFPGTLGLTQAQVSSGRSPIYAFEANGGVRLTSLGGAFVPGPNLIEPRDISLTGFRVPPPGVIVDIKHVNGGPTLQTPPLGDANIFGVDPTANALIRFDAATGAPVQVIPLPASAAGKLGGVALARNGAELVALVGVGTEVMAYDAIFGTPAGRFSTAGLAAEGLAAVTGIGTGGQTTVLVDSAPGTGNGANGVAQAIDVTASLATGRAVAIGLPFAGVPGTGTLSALGSAHFDTFQPNLLQAGILTINPSGGVLAEAARAAVTSQGLDITATPNGTIQGDASPALGSLESSLALDLGVVNGRNVVALLSPSGLANQGRFALDDPNPLSDLSESFHPELANTALVDVQGNVQSFTARTATGLVLNDAGNLNLLAIGRAADSTVVGLPFGHVNIPIRNNVSILTNSRLIAERGGVVVAPNARQVGPLSLP